MCHHFCVRPVVKRNPVLAPIDTRLYNKPQNGSAPKRSRLQHNQSGYSSQFGSKKFEFGLIDAPRFGPQDLHHIQRLHAPYKFEDANTSSMRLDASKRKIYMMLGKRFENFAFQNIDSFFIFAIFMQSN